MAGEEDKPSPEFLKVLLPGVRKIHEGRGQNIMTIPFHYSQEEQLPLQEGGELQWRPEPDS